MSTALQDGAKIGLVKPDFGVAGGFEHLLDRLQAILVSSGHDVTTVTVPGRQLPRPIWGQPDAASRWFEHPDFFNYLGMVHDTRRLELDDFDLVMSTQPPSYLAPHDRILGLFYHQTRIFYELAEPYIEAGFVDRTLHEAACRHIQAIDQAHLGGTVGWLAGSQECADRLVDAWRVSDPIDLLSAPPLIDDARDPSPWRGDGAVLCIGRLEWPKRAELVVAAGHLLQRETVILGSGGRLAHLKRLDGDIAAGRFDPQSLPATVLGNIDQAATKRLRLRPSTTRHTSPVRFAGHVSNDERNDAYRAASICIAPAYREDYGLTALEAMAMGCPVIVCADGGGLVEIVETTGGGIVVDPTPDAIAAGVRRITEDPALASDLRQRALDVRGSHTWARAEQQLMTAVERALAAG